MAAPQFSETGIASVVSTAPTAFAARLGFGQKKPIGPFCWHGRLRGRVSNLGPRASDRAAVRVTSASSRTDRVRVVAVARHGSSGLERSRRKAPTAARLRRPSARAAGKGLRGPRRGKEPLSFLHPSHAASATEVRAACRSAPRSPSVKGFSDAKGFAWYPARPACGWASVARASASRVGLFDRLRFVSAPARAVSASAPARPSGPAGRRSRRAAISRGRADRRPFPGPTGCRRHWAPFPDRLSVWSRSAKPWSRSARSLIAGVRQIGQATVDRALPRPPARTGPAPAVRASASERKVSTRSCSPAMSGVGRAPITEQIKCDANSDHSGQ